MTASPEDHGTALIRLESKVDRLGDKLDAQTNAVMAQMTYGDRENATAIMDVKDRMATMDAAWKATLASWEAEWRREIAVVTSSIDDLKTALKEQSDKISNRRWNIVQGIAFPILVLLLLALLKAGLVVPK